MEKVKKEEVDFWTSRHEWVKQIGLPRDMQRNMASEAEARVQAGAKLVASEGESKANNRLVEAGDSLDVVSIHLRSVSFLAPTGAPEEGILCVRACVCPCVRHFPQKNIEKEF